MNDHDIFKLDMIKTYYIVDSKLSLSSCSHVVFHVGYSCWLTTFVNKLMIHISRGPLVKIWESQTAHISPSTEGKTGGSSHSLPPEVLIIISLSFLKKTNLWKIITIYIFVNFTQCQCLRPSPVSLVDSEPYLQRPAQQSPNLVVT